MEHSLADFKSISETPTGDPDAEVRWSIRRHPSGNGEEDPASDEDWPMALAIEGLRELPLKHRDLLPSYVNDMFNASELPSLPADTRYLDTEHHTLSLEDEKRAVLQWRQDL